MDGGKQACPVCGQAVKSVVRRHKTLGAWVPVWGPGACRNPECSEYTGSPRAPRRSPARPRPQRSGQPQAGQPQPLRPGPEHRPPESAQGGLTP
ncbi:hypothetical protein ABZ619_30200 [Streptomyces sp. NPDC007851]|uniref:hypothetical protein n=1 Tax=Streptomyces sp. NPDC007851 TaxID=3155008 RepID=UPI0033FB168B